MNRSTSRPATRTARRRSRMAAGLAVVGLCAAGFLAATASASADPRTPGDDNTVDFTGAVRSDVCSGTLIKVPDSRPDDPALILSAGHCRQPEVPAPGEVIVDEPSDVEWELLDADAEPAGTVTSQAIAFATMTDIDASLFTVTSSYAEIDDEFGIEPRLLSPDRPSEGDAVTTLSGLWQHTESCVIDAFVPELRIDDYAWKDAIRLGKHCLSRAGDSGSPTIDDRTGDVVGILTTENTDGAECERQNPCEVDDDGNVTVHLGYSYSQRGDLIVDCVAPGNLVDLDLPDCELPKPKS